jgi:type II secretory pathway predicted ATPase ExeA
VDFNSYISGEVTRLCVEAKARPVLIVDEAQHLRSDLLEDLRLLTKYNMDAEDRLTLLLMAHAELRLRLAMAAHEAIAQQARRRHSSIAGRLLPSDLHGATRRPPRRRAPRRPRPRRADSPAW